LPKQVGRSGTENQKPAGLLPPPPALVDQPAQCGEQLRNPLHFIENHQIVFMPREIECRVRELLSIHLRFQIQIDALSPLRDRMGKRSLADLARTEQSHSRHMAKAFPNQSFDSTRYHPGSYGILCQICRDDLSRHGTSPGAGS
jgi:hypothetical protein